MPGVIALAQVSLGEVKPKPGLDHVVLEILGDQGRSLAGDPVTGRGVKGETSKGAAPDPLMLLEKINGKGEEGVKQKSSSP